jgi:hypothetical protein
VQGVAGVLASERIGVDLPREGYWSRNKLIHATRHAGLAALLHISQRVA